MRHWFPIPLLALALLASVTSSAPAAPAEGPLGRLDSGASAWKQIVPLVRKRVGGKHDGFDFQPTLQVKTASGYRVEVTDFDGAIAAIVSRGRHAATAYLAKGVATSRRLKANFGRFGKLDMRFQPSPHLAPLPRRDHCHGLFRHLKRRGVWVGSFRFSGEGGYVSVGIHRAPGSIRRETPVCAHLPFGRRRTATASSGPFASFVHHEILVAGWHRGLESTYLFAFRTPLGSLFVARNDVALGSVGILHFAFVAKRSGGLLVNDSLTHAEAEPPPPFHGVGIYTAAPDGAETWSGDLAVDFPGLPSFPLTGEEFKVEVQRPLSGAGR